MKLILVFLSLKNNTCIDVLTEPVNKWTNLNGTDLLELIYDKPKRWAMIQVKRTTCL